MGKPAASAAQSAALSARRKSWRNHSIVVMGYTRTAFSYNLGAIFAEK
jgi:hypothetical protein